MDTREMTRRQQAIVWMNEYPNVVAMFRKFATLMVKRERRFGINLLRERVRWECIYAYDTEYKFCNTHSPYVARRLLCEVHGLQFHMRCKLTQDEKIIGKIRLCPEGLKPEDAYDDEKAGLVILDVGG